MFNQVLTATTMADLGIITEFQAIATQAISDMGAIVPIAVSLLAIPIGFKLVKRFFVKSV